MANIFQTTYSNAFIEKHLLYYDSNFTEIVPRFPINNIDSDDGLAPHRLQAIL